MSDKESEKSDRWSEEAEESTEETENKRETLKNTVPCRNMARQGKCVVDTCTFAHSTGDLRELPCVREDCDMTRCRNIHDGESRDEWLKRSGYSTLFSKKSLRKNTGKDKLVILYTPGYSKKVHRLVDMAVNAGITNVELVAKK